jgi:hypothetical protein
VGKKTVGLPKKFSDQKIRVHFMRKSSPAVRWFFSSPTRVIHWFCHQLLQYGICQRKVHYYHSAMGAQSSKIENASAQTRRANKQSQDDCLSKSTELTEDSSLPSSPAVAYFWSKGGARPRRSGPGPTSSSLSQSMLPPRKEAIAAHRTWQQPRANSEPPIATRAVPVKRPPNDGMYNDLDDAAYLAKMYEFRTWEMYRRITNARKNSSYASNGSHMDNARSEDASDSEWENLQHDLVDSSPSGQDMIFLFDFD